MIWFTADLHFGHQNIIKYCNRPFETAHDMDDVLIANWNALIKPDDSVYVLGDFSMISSPLILNSWFNQLNGHKFLIRGNHDSNICTRLPWVQVEDVKEIKYKDSKLWLSHYAHRSWPGSYHGSYHLFGHSHGMLPDFRRSMDVGVDANDFKPISIDQVIEKLSGQEASE